MVDLSSVFQAVLYFMGAMVTAFVLPWIRAKLSAEKQAELADWVEIAVTAAEQLYVGSGRGEEKKAYVLEFLAGKGYKVDAGGVYAAVNALIEAAVYQLRQGW